MGLFLSQNRSKNEWSKNYPQKADCPEFDFTPILELNLLPGNNSCTHSRYTFNDARNSWM